MRPGVQVDTTALKRAAEGRSPNPSAQRVGGTNTARSALTSAQRAADAARKVDPDCVGLEVADALSTQLDDAIEDLIRLSRQLRSRVSSDAWMKPTDKLWQERWTEILTSRDETGRWPANNSTDAHVKALARWLAFQPQQHRNHRLSDERQAMLRAAGFRLTGNPRIRAAESGAK